ncbi:MAG: transcriptional repressor [Thermoanaerobaculia bacterium]|nr:transcriptional repressor [Acidobacteriota bacterium]
MSAAVSNAIRRRETRQRRLVYRAVAQTDSHPTAEWVYERVRRAMPRVSLGTVYRNLQLLVAEGRLTTWTRGRTTRYDADVEPHDHFVCRSCGLLLDVERAPEAISSERPLRARGHRIETRVLEFIGLCRNCRRSRRDGGEGIHA